MQQLHKLCITNELEGFKKATGLTEGTDRSVWTAPTLGSGSVFVGCADGILYSFEQKSLKRGWSFQAGGPIRSSASFAGGTVYFGCDDGNLYAVDAASGNETGKCAIGEGGNLSSPCIGDGVVFIGSGDGFIYAVK
jgi:outer membrane protein assembly factor BamB